MSAPSLLAVITPRIGLLMEELAKVIAEEHLPTIKTFVEGFVRYWVDLCRVHDCTRGLDVQAYQAPADIVLVFLTPTEDADAHVIVGVTDMKPWPPAHFAGQLWRLVSSEK